LQRSLVVYFISAQALKTQTCENADGVHKSNQIDRGLEDLTAVVNPCIDYLWSENTFILEKVLLNVSIIKRQLVIEHWRETHLDDNQILLHDAQCYFVG